MKAKAKFSYFYTKLNVLINSLKNSQYILSVRDNRDIIWTSMIISLLLLLISYPGIMYADSYRRYEQIGKLDFAVRAFLTGNRNLVRESCWWTLTPIYFLDFSVKLTGNVALYIYLQSFFFLAVLYTIAKRLISNRTVLITVYILGTPVFCGYAVYHEASISCVTAIMAIVLLIWKWDEFHIKMDKMITAMLLVFLSFITFGYRANAFTILPVLIALVFVKLKKKSQAVMMSAAIAVGFCFVSVIPKAINIDTMSSYAGGFVWEMISMIQTMDEERQKEYMGYLDDIFGEGITADAVALNTYTDYDSEINDIWWGHPFDIDEVSQKENTRAVIKKYIMLMIKEPDVFFKIKWSFAAHTMGITMPLRFYEFFYNAWDYMPVFGFNDAKPRQIFVDYIQQYMEFMKLFRRPWIMFTVSFILIAVRRWKAGEKEKELTMQEALFGIAIFYYGAYVLNTQSFEFRYFFPSWLLLFLIISSFFAQICGRSKRRTALYMIFGFWMLITLGGGYLKLNEEGDSMVNTVMRDGRLLYQTEDQVVYYLHNRLYFIANASANTGLPYFLHYCSEDEIEVIDDFSFRNNSLDTSIFYPKIAVKEVPLKTFGKIEVGQYYGDTRIWQEFIEASEFLITPQELSVLDFTDDNWTNGYSNYENCFLAADVSLENCMLAGEKIVLQDGRATVITNTEVVGGYQRIYTADDLSVCGQRKYFIDK